MVDYAVRRTREHLLRFTRLYDQIKGNQLDERWLGQVESRDNLFPEIDYRVYRPQA
jgi:1,4-alpha-glucan branching enzyme